MNEKRKLSARQVLEDVRDGLSDEQLISKYQLSSSKLQGVFRKLVEQGWLKQSELDARTSLFGESIDLTPNEESAGKRPGSGATPGPSNGHTMIYCPQCRREVVPTPGQQFCNFCGSPLAGSEEGKYSPWEDAENLGWPQAFIQTINNSLFSTKSFFAQLPSYGGYQKPLIFGIILASIGMIFQQVWSVVFQMGPLGQYGGRAMAIALIVFAPVLAAILLPLSSLLFHACLLLVSERTHKGFEATLRVCCYSRSAGLCQFVPVLGPLADAILGTYLLVIGLREVHGISTGKAAVAVFLPWIVIIVVGAMLVFVAFKAGF